MAYNKATQVDPEQQLAWQGLCSFYEKLSKEKHLSSLSEVYAKLLTFQQEDIAKYRFICEKLVKVYEKLQEWQKVVDLNLALLQKLADDGVPGRCDTWRDIIHSYGQLQNLNSQKVQQGYQYLIENLPEDKLKASWIEYIQWLLKKKSLVIDDVQTQCRGMVDRLPLSNFAAITLQSIQMQIWLDTHAADPFKACTKNIDDIMSKLPITSTVHYAVTAITKVKNGAMGEAMEAAAQGISADKNISAWAIYALCASKTHDLNAVDQACKTIYHLLSVKDRQWFGGSTQPLEGVITLLHAQFLFKNHQIRRALEVINTQSQLNAGLMEVKLLCLVEQDSLDEAGKLLQGNTVLSSCQHQSWTGWLAYHKRDMHTAQQWLE